MVTKKKTTARKGTTVEQAVESAAQDQQDTGRQDRLRALREKRKDLPSKTPGGDAASAGWQLSDDAEGGDRKRQLVKKLIKKRMAKGGGGKAGPSGEGLGQYPRLKAMLEQRGGQQTDESPVDLVQLEARVTKLESALESILEKLEAARIEKS